MGILSREGYELTPHAAEAEILVVNTCSFIESAQKESVDTILEMAEHKKFGAAKKLIVAGCLVERYRNQILEQVPEVDAVVGTGEVERIIEAVEGDLKVLPAAPPAFLYHDLTPRIVTTPRHAAYIKIAEGCDHPCSFCIIPQLRGKFRLEGVPVVDGGHGQPGIEHRVEQLVGTQRLRQVTAVAEHPAAAVDVHHQRRRRRGRRHPQVQLQRTIPERHRVGDAREVPGAIRFHDGLGRWQESRRSGPWWLFGRYRHVVINSGVSGIATMLV